MSPEGGPKDVTPPRVVNADPAALTIHFASKEIRITFDEFIQLKDQAKQINIAPPTLPHTEIALRGKSLLIKLKDSLKANTTYSINFGDAISDLTEGNILHNFIYSFSTGAYIDSLSLSGNVISAFDLQPRKDVLAMLYVNENDTLPLDSLPFHVKPYYVSKTNDKGEFSFHNLRDVPFLLFALKDLNDNMIFDSRSENIAFSDSLVMGIFVPPPGTTDTTLKKDTIVKKDTSLQKQDTAGLIRIITSAHTLRMFQEEDSVQRILKADMVNEDQIGVVFKYPAINPEFFPINMSDSLLHLIKEFSVSRDTVFIWLRPAPKDSLYLKIADAGRTLDTARIDLKKKTPKKKKSANAPPLKLTNNMADGRLNQYLGDPLVTFSYPIAKANLSMILMVDGKDTTKAQALFTDSVKRKLRILSKWKEDHPYKIIIPDSVFYSVNGLSNDSAIIRFRSHSPVDFGSIMMDIKVTAPSDYIIQLLDDKDNVIYHQTISSSGKIKFEFLSPAKYKVKAILDKNRNGKWDTGKFSKLLQPEQVEYFQKIIEVRANWDIDESWEL